MNTIKKTRLLHLTNTTGIINGTNKSAMLSPKFWAQCAAVVSSLASMNAVHANPDTFNIASGQTFVVDTKISGTGTLTKAGAGTMELDYDNSTTTDASPLDTAFTGPTNVTAGTLQVDLGGALGGAGGGLLTMSDATTLVAGANTLIVPNAIQLGSAASAAVTVNVGANTFELTGVISEYTSGSSGSCSLSVAGTGILNLSPTAANTYTGGTTLGGTSTLKIGNANAIPTTGAITLGAGTTLEDSSTSGVTLTNALTLTGDANVSVDSGITTTASGAVTGAHTLTANGAGTLVLSGTNSGGSTALTIAAGTVSVAADTNIPGGTLTLDGGKLLASAGYTSSKGITMAASSSIGAASEQILTYEGAISDTTGTTLTINSGTVYLNADQSGNTHTNIVVDGTGTATLKLGASGTGSVTSYLPGGSTTTVTVQNSGVLQAAATMSLGKVLTVGLGNPVLDANQHVVTLDQGVTGANPLTINSTGGAGTVILQANNVAQSTSLTVGTNGILQYTDTINLPAGSGAMLTMSGGTLKVPASNNASATVPTGVTFNVGAASTLDVGDSSTLTFAVPFTDIAGNALTIQNSTSSSSANGTVAFTQYVSGTTAATDNSASKTAITVGTGTPNTSHVTYLISDPLAKEIPGAATAFTLNGGTLATAASSAITTAQVITLGANSNVAVGADATLTLNGALAGGHALNANGTGTLVLGGTNNTVSGQSLTVSTGATVQVALPANVPGSSTPAITLAGGTFEPTATMTLANPLTLNESSVLSIPSSVALTASGALTGLWTLSMGDAGTFIPTADNHLSPTSLSLGGGVMQITAATQLPGASGAVLTMNGGTMQVPTVTGADCTVNMPSNLGIAITANSTFDVQGGFSSANMLTINAPFTDTVGHTLSLTKTGVSTHAAIVTMASGVDNSASETILSVGTGVALQINAAKNIPGTASGSLKLDGGTLVPAVDALTITRPVVVTTASTIDTTNAATTGLTVSGAVTLTQGLTVTGGNKLILSSANVQGGGITTSGSGTTLSLANAAAAGTGTVTLGTGTELECAVSGDAGTIANAIAMSATAADTATLLATNSFTASGVISGAADLTITGTAKTVTLSGTNTYTGKTTLAGTATLSVSAANQLSAAALVMGAGTTLNVTTGFTLLGGIKLG